MAHKENVMLTILLQGIPEVYDGFTWSEKTQLSWVHPEHLEPW